MTIVRIDKHHHNLQIYHKNKSNNIFYGRKVNIKINIFDGLFNSSPRAGFGRLMPTTKMRL